MTPQESQIPENKKKQAKKLEEHEDDFNEEKKIYVREIDIMHAEQRELLVKLFDMSFKSLQNN